MSGTTVESRPALENSTQDGASLRAASLVAGTEEGRLLVETQGKPLLWRRWGPYVSECSWDVW